MSFVSSVAGGLRRKFHWSNSPEAWADRIGLATAFGLFLAWGVIAFVWPTPAVVLATGAVVFTIVAVLERLSVVKLLGPVFTYDVIRSARRGRYFLLRWLYAVGLLLLLLYVHSIWALENRFRYGADTGENEFKALSRLAEQYFIAYAIVQFAAVVILAPAYFGGAIAEEKERKTLEFLLATDLNNSEIVFGKLAARAGNLTLFLLTGLPVLSLMQFFGGIDPGFLLVSAAVTALTAGSLAGLGLLNSTMRRRARDAIVLTYFAAVGYAALTGLSFFLKMLFAHYGWVATIWPVYSFTFLGVEFDSTGITTTDLFDWFNVGNPIFGMVEVGQAIGRGGYYGDVLAEQLKKYAVWHGLVAVVSLTWAVARLRSVALTQAAGPRRAKPKGRARKRPPVGLKPMLWKEVQVEGNVRFGWGGYSFVMLLVAASFVPAGLIFYSMAFDMNNRFIGLYGHRWDEFGQAINIWLRFMNGIVGSLMLLGVAVRASGAVSGERDKDTLTSLLTTPLTTGEILWAKWWGSLTSVRGLLLWLGLIWAAALVVGGVHLVALPLSVIVWCAPAVFFATIGLWFSTVCKSTLRATAWSLVAALIAGGAHWVCMGMCCYMPLALVSHGGGSEFRWLTFFELGLTPPAVLGIVPFRESRELDIDSQGLFTGFAVVGAVLWCVGAAVLGHFTHERFQEITHRNQWERRPIHPKDWDETAPVVRAAEGE